MYVNQMEKKQGTIKECSDEGFSIHFYIITSLLTLLSCTWFLWNYEARQFLFRKLSTTCVCVCRFKRRLRRVETRRKPFIAQPNVINERWWQLIICFCYQETKLSPSFLTHSEEGYNRKACQLEDDKGKSQMMKNVNKIISTNPHGDCRIGKIQNDVNQKFDMCNMTNIDI